MAGAPTPTPAAGALAVPVKLNVGGPALGGYTPDGPYVRSGGGTRTGTIVRPVAGTTTAALYHTFRYGRTVAYELPVAPGAYTVRLMFAEVYVWTSAVGKRVFDIAIGDGATAAPPVVLADYDLFADAGAATAVVKSFDVTVGGGPLVISMVASVQNVAIQAIEVVVAGGSGAPTPAPTLAPTPTPEMPTAKPTPSSATSTPTPTPTPAPAVAAAWSPLPDAPASARRHENCFVNHRNRFYLIGGRSRQSPGLLTLVYTPSTATWAPAAPPPYTPGGVHHMQCVSFEGAIVLVAAWTGIYPAETLLERVLVYNSTADAWSAGDVIPAAFNRGSAAAVVHAGAIYLAGGNVGGHGARSESSTLLTRYVPSTTGRAASWSARAPLPRSRDHVYGVVSRGQLVLAGGRDGGNATPFNAVRTAIDVYSFQADTWTTLPRAALAHGRGAPAVAALGDTVVVAGGEGGGRVWPETEVLDVAAGRMVTPAPPAAMVRGRHASPAVVCAGAAYVVAGSRDQGGTPELNSFEVYSAGAAAPCVQEDDEGQVRPAWKKTSRGR